MVVNALVTADNTILIDPTVSINADAFNCYEVEFEFQVPWDSELTLYAIFKPKFDVPVYITLDSDNKCIIPAQTYHRFSKLGIGLKGQKFDGELLVKQETTNLYFVPVRKSAGNFIEDLL